jgi:hypothetical protein
MFSESIGTRAAVVYQQLDIPLQVQGVGGVQKGRTIEMNQDQILNEWREHLVKKLQDRYGLAAEKAEMKADLWLQWINKQPNLQPHNIAMAERDERSPSRLNSRLSSGKSRSAAFRPL